MLKLFFKNKKTQIQYNNNFIILSKPLYNIINIKSIKVRFKGKTYKWFLKKKVFFLTFNKKNKTNLFFFHKIRKKNFYKFKKRLFLLSNKEKFFLYKAFKDTRLYNIFTHRCLKINNKFILKKRGKISTYR